MSDIKVRTNNQPHDVIDACELTPAEREEFDYLDWPAIDAGKDSASFFRYRGDVHDLGNFERGNPVPADSNLPAHLSKWDGHHTDSFFSAIVVRYVNDGEQVIVGLVTT